MYYGSGTLDRIASCSRRMQRASGRRLYCLSVCL